MKLGDTGEAFFVEEVENENLKLITTLHALSQNEKERD